MTDMSIGRNRIVVFIPQLAPAHTRILNLEDIVCLMPQAVSLTISETRKTCVLIGLVGRLE